MLQQILWWFRRYIYHVQRERERWKSIFSFHFFFDFLGRTSYAVSIPQAFSRMYGSLAIRYLFNSESTHARVRAHRRKREWWIWNMESEKDEKKRATRFYKYGMCFARERIVYTHAFIHIRDLCTETRAQTVKYIETTKYIAAESYIIIIICVIYIFCCCCISSRSLSLSTRDVAVLLLMMILCRSQCCLFIFIRIYIYIYLVHTYNSFILYFSSRFLLRWIVLQFRWICSFQFSQ